MRLDLLHLHLELSRRDALRYGAAGAAAFGLVASGAPQRAGATGTEPTQDGGTDDRPYDDTMFDPKDVLAGAWAPGPYGPGDQRGTLNELTPAHTADALEVLRRGRPVQSYQLGQQMFNAFPAFPAEPPRVHEMRLLVNGYQPPADFVAKGGLLASITPLGPNLASAHEERFLQNYTFQIGTQVDGLGHVGVSDMFYNGFRGAQLASATGLLKLGTETMGPIVTRAVIYDVVGLKVAQRATGDLRTAPNGSPILRDDYRITIDDLRRCLDRQRVRGVGPGDVPIIYTGWSQLPVDDPERYLAQEPGIYLAEARWFAQRRVALIAADNWGLELRSAAVTNLFPCHQELFGKHGVRIGEGSSRPARSRTTCSRGFSSSRRRTFGAPRPGPHHRCCWVSQGARQGTDRSSGARTERSAGSARQADAGPPGCRRPHRRFGLAPGRSRVRSPRPGQPAPGVRTGR